jgi:hypothetical protein
MYVEYFTSAEDKEEDVAEICKIDYTIPVILFNQNQKPILIGLITSMQKVINVVNKINSETIKIEIEPIEIEDILSYSIIDDIEDHILPSSET